MKTTPKADSTAGLRREQRPCSALFGHLPLEDRVSALATAWDGAAASLKRMGRLAEANRLEMSAEELRMILDPEQCDWRGMACPKGDGCRLPKGHDGPHKFKDDSKLTPQNSVISQPGSVDNTQNGQASGSRA